METMQVKLMKTKNLLMSSGLLLSLLLAGCSTDDTTDTSNTDSTTSDDTTSTVVDLTNDSDSTSTADLSFDFTQEDLRTEVYDAEIITLDGTSASTDGNNVSISGSVITIDTEGDYIITGTLSDGQIIVNATEGEEVHIVLDNASITNTNGSAIVITGGDKVIITLAEGTSNVIKDGSAYVQAEEEPNAAIFSTSDLTFNGTGELVISANYNHGIYSKDDLRLIDVNITIDAANDAIKGKDVVWAQGVTLNITAEGDGIVSSNAESTDVGNVLIADSNITINAGLDGIQAENILEIDSGSYVITSGTLMSGDESGKGLKAVNEIIIDAGDIIITAKDDSIHTNGALTIDAGTITLSSGDDGLHADNSITINGGDITIEESYEAIEASVITLNDGYLDLTSFDDGINGSSGSGSQSMSAESGVSVTINGGTLVMDASGDGLDSNGSLIMNDGTVIVFGPTNNGNGAIDYNGQFTLNGGTLLAVGSSGMAEQASSSTQNSVLINFSGVSAGETVSIIDESGNIIVSVQALKAFNSIVYSGTNLVNGDYILVSGGSTDATYENNISTSGTLSDYTSIGTFSISQTITSFGSSASQPGGTRPSRN